MSVELKTPPKVIEQRSYKKLVRRIIEADGEWLCLSLDEIAPGQSVPAKQTRISQAASARGIKVQTTYQGGSIYVRLVKGRE
jgi:hypothetical protein